MNNFSASNFIFNAAIGAVAAICAIFLTYALYGLALSYLFESASESNFKSYGWLILIFAVICCLTSAILIGSAMFSNDNFNYDPERKRVQNSGPLGLYFRSITDKDTNVFNLINSYELIKYNSSKIKFVIGELEKYMRCNPPFFEETCIKKRKEYFDQIKIYFDIISKHVINFKNNSNEQELITIINDIKLALDNFNSTPDESDRILASLEVSSYLESFVDTVKTSCEEFNSASGTS